MDFEFISTYLEFNAGNECPKNYHMWSALVLLAAAVHKRVRVSWGYFDVYPNLFVCLVGRQGFRKSTAKDIAADLFTEVFPDYPTGASVQTREDIVRFMASDECGYSFTNELNEMVEVRPIVFFVNELKNFLSVDPGKMIDFLTDIYDRKRFKSSTIKRGLEDIVNPCLNILACETPKWITDKLKADIITGGFARRVIYVYETEQTLRIPFPERPKNAATMWTEMKEHLLRVADTTGLFQWSDAARIFWSDWYPLLIKPEDEIMEGYYSSKHIQALKVAMLIALAESPIELVLTTDRLQKAIALLDSIEGNMPKLSVAAGRNELAVPTQTILELLAKNGGWMSEKALRCRMGKDLTPVEQLSVLRYLQETDQIFVREVEDVQKVRRQMVMLRAKYEELTKKKTP